MAAANLCCNLQSNGLLSCIIGFIQIHEDEVGNKDKAVDSLSVHTLTCSFIKKTELFNSNVSGFEGQNIHLVPKQFDRFRVRCISGQALLAPPIYYRIAGKPPPSSAKQPQRHLCSVIIQQIIPDSQIKPKQVAQRHKEIHTYLLTSLAICLTQPMVDFMHEMIAQRWMQKKIHPPTN